MKQRRLITILIVFFFLLITLIFFGGNYLINKGGWGIFPTPLERQQTRDRICRFVEDLQLGLSKNQVEEIVNKHDLPDISVSHEKSEIRLRTPIEWGAQNWVVYLIFENDLLSEIKIRTEDSRSHKPKEAPPDIVYSQE
ncbi:MAG: hypothetical protein FVQ79_09340 [Planctomycetes bacterium]|nr:hypothetical protein [Planctomycetota bacterium]